MASSRTIVIAGAGIGGLTAAIALAKKGFRAVVCEQSAKLEETGAGIQLSPNATHILNALGVGEKLKPSIVVPEALSIKQARSGWEIAHMPLGHAVEFRFGAPYWIVHRGDLQTALLQTAQTHPDVVLRLGARVDDFALHAHGVTAQVRQGTSAKEERALALIGADGLWSLARRQLGGGVAPRFRNRTAWRATVPASTIGEEFRKPVIHLWLGRQCPSCPLSRCAAAS